MLRSLYTVLLLPLLVSACVVREPDPAPTPAQDGEANATLTVRTLSEAEVITGAASEENRRWIADTLFEGLQALDADRLLTPVDDNAHARFMRVLAREPDNEIALQGLQDIVARYLALSLEASRRGLFREAEQMLDQARFVDAEHPDIASARMTLQTEMDSGDLFFNLDNREFARRSEAARQQLADIARQAKQHGAFFLITAPDDDQARWMFSVMRDAVDGYRLRGNIEMASQTNIRLRIPGD